MRFIIGVIIALSVLDAGKRLMLYFVGNDEKDKAVFVIDAVIAFIGIISLLILKTYR